MNIYRNGHLGQENFEQGVKSPFTLSLASVMTSCLFELKTSTDIFQLKNGLAGDKLK